MGNEEYADVSCLEEWLERKGWSTDLTEEEQKRLEGGFVGEYSDARAAMWRRDYESLDPADKALLDNETHPSYSWDRAAEAQTYLKELQRKLAAAEFVAGVTMSRYHGNTIVFTVYLTRDLPWREYRKVIPEFFRGFQVFALNPHHRLQS